MPSSRSNLPSSRSCITAIEVKSLEIEQIEYSVSASASWPDSGSARPIPPDANSSSRWTNEYDAAGTPDSPRSFSTQTVQAARASSIRGSEATDFAGSSAVATPEIRINAKTKNNRRMTTSLMTLFMSEGLSPSPQNSANFCAES